MICFCGELRKIALVGNHCSKACMHTNSVMHDATLAPDLSWRVLHSTQRDNHHPASDSKSSETKGPSRRIAPVKTRKYPGATPKPACGWWASEITSEVGQAPHALGSVCFHTVSHSASVAGGCSFPNFPVTKQTVRRGFPPAINPERVSGWKVVKKKMEQLFMWQGVMTSCCAFTTALPLAASHLIHTSTLK